MSRLTVGARYLCSSHMGKEKREREGRLPMSLKVPITLHALTVQRVINAADIH